MPTGTIVLLGAFAGLTIYLGLPVARLKNASPTLKTFLSMVATGVLIFLFFDVINQASEPINAAIGQVRAHHTGGGTLAGDIILMALGIGLGLIGLAYFNKYVMMRIRFGPRPEAGGAPAPAPAAPQLALAAANAAALEAGKAIPVVRAPAPNAAAVPAAPAQELSPQMLALIIATGIGMHNFSEGLAIGQSAAAGELSLAAVLIIGFGLHNMTEGFGIAGPLTGKPVSWRFLALLGLIGGGPTFLGTVFGIAFHSTALFIFCLAFAAGAIIYVVAELLGVAKRARAQEIVMFGLFIGFFLGYVTDLIVTFGGA
jgi:ZIP family zinc transporter